MAPLFKNTPPCRNNAIIAFGIHCSNKNRPQGSSHKSTHFGQVQILRCVRKLSFQLHNLFVSSLASVIKFSPAAPDIGPGSGRGR
jgi:hypothetical protein